MGDDKKEYYLGFGAGTSIKRREIGFVDTLDSRMKYQDDLRFKMIALAIRDKDFEMLNTLRAREIPLLYTINPIHHWTLRDTQLPSSANVEQMIESIATSENTVISYFLDEFETEAEMNALRSTFVFPYAGKVLDSLITGKRIAESKRFLEKAIEHNKKVQKKLKKLVDKSKASCKELNSGLHNASYYDDNYFKREAWREYYFYADTHINSTPRKSLGGRTPYSIALETMGEDVLNAFQLRPIAPDEVNLTPKLIRFNH